MAPEPPASEPPPPSGKARLRARSPKGSAIRPEVMQALDRLEASLGDVGKWEQMLTGQATPSVPAPPGAEADPEATAAVPIVPPPPPGAPQQGEPGAPLLRHDASTADKAAAIPPIVPPGTSILGEFQTPTDPVPPFPAQRESVLYQARPLSTAGATSPDEQARRRRAGRALSWVGVVLVVLGIGYFTLIRDDGDTDVNQLPALDESVESTRRTTSTRLTTTSSSSTTVAVTAPATVPVSAPATTPTTKKPTTTTTKKPVTATTQPAVTTTVPPQTTTTFKPILCNPNRPPTPGCVTTTTPGP